MSALRAVSICSGIGAFDLALERAGITIVAQVEIDPHCRRVLERHYPEVPRWNDLTTLDPASLPAADVVAGGPPCQPVSAAGKGLAQADERWLWPSVVRLVAGVRPRYVLLENPPALLGRGMGDVLGALAEIGYDAEWQCIAAADIGAPHLRDRVWILAYPDGEGEPQPRWALGEVGRRTGDGGEPLADADRLGLQGREQAGGPPLLAPGAGAVADPGGHRRGEGRPEPGVRQRFAASAGRGAPMGDANAWGWQEGRPAPESAQGPHALRPGPDGRNRGIKHPESVLGRVLDGAPAWLDGYRWPAPPGQPQYPWEPPRTVAPRTVPDRGRRVSACGNAVVVPVAELIGRAIVAHDAEQAGRVSA